MTDPNTKRPENRCLNCGDLTGYVGGSDPRRAAMRLCIPCFKLSYNGTAFVCRKGQAPRGHRKVPRSIKKARAAANRQAARRGKPAPFPRKDPSSQHMVCFEGVWYPTTPTPPAGANTGGGPSSPVGRIGSDPSASLCGDRKPRTSC